MSTRKSTTWDGSSGIQIKKGDDAKLLEALAQLSDVEVLVGFPEDTASRVAGASINNASLGYIHDNGAPEQNIPARPFMIPGIEAAQGPLVAKLGQIAKAAVNPKAKGDVVEKGLHQVGLIAKLAIQNKINEGIPPPLAKSTLQARARRGRKGAKEELALRKAGVAPSTAFAKPLIDTGQLRNAVSYAIRSRKKRK